MRREEMAGICRRSATLVCVSLACLYALSVWAQCGGDAVRGVRFAFERGGVTLATYRFPSDLTGPMPAMFSRVFSEGPVEWLPQVDHLDPLTSTGWAVTYVSVPLWIPLLIVLPVTMSLWRRHFLVKRFAATNRCKKCGYAMAGLATSASTCPECGTTPANAAP
jgi:hypothetical protein